MRQPGADILGDSRFVTAFDELVRLRRDVRRFRSAPVGEHLVDEVVAGARFAPSVGLSEPLRLVRLVSETARSDVLANFERANREALAGYAGQMARTYADLKLAGLREAPVQFAVFCDDDTGKGRGLGAVTIPETKAYSCACAIMVMWLAAAARGLGLGWVTIFDVPGLVASLGVVPQWRFMGCICLGWPQEQHYDPELERAGWEVRCEAGPVVAVR